MLLMSKNVSKYTQKFLLIIENENFHFFMGHKTVQGSEHHEQKFTPIFVELYDGG